MKEKSNLLWVLNVSERKAKALFACSIVLAFAQSVCLAGVPLLLSRIIASAQAGDIRGLLARFLAAAGLSLASSAVAFLLKATEGAGVACLQENIQSRGIDDVLAKEHTEYERQTVQYWIGRLTSDASEISEAVMRQVPSFFSAFSFLLMAVLVLVRLFPAAVVALVPAGFSQLTVILFFSGFLRKEAAMVQKADNSARFQFGEVLKGIPVIRVFGRERQAAKAAKAAASEVKAEKTRQSVRESVYTLLTQFCLHLGYLAGIFVCAWSVAQGNTDYGVIVAVLQLIKQVGSPFSNFVTFIPTWEKAMTGADRLRELSLATNSRPSDSADLGRRFSESGKSIELRNIRFAWAGKPAVFEGDSFTFRKGVFSVVKGASGSGKSTLLKLILGLARPEEGEVFALMEDGSRISAGKAENLFAYVPQDNAVWSSTVAEVVTFQKELSENEKAKLEAALELACASEFVRSLPEGVQTAVGQSGNQLSAGQRQRLAIARAVYSDRPVLVLDEATSAVDRETEKAILDNLAGLGKTVIMTRHPSLPALGADVEAFTIAQRYSESFNGR